MQSYANRGGESGVDAYEIGSDYIRVQFKSGDPYEYSYESCDQASVETMKKLARDGQGLHSFIMNNVKNDYVR